MRSVNVNAAVSVGFVTCYQPFSNLKIDNFPILYTRGLVCGHSQNHFSEQYTGLKLLSWSKQKGCVLHVFQVI